MATSMISSKLVSKLFPRNLTCIRSRLHSSKSIDICKVPLNEPLPGLPQPIFVNSSKLNHDTKVTTLDNGLRVASQNKFGQFCTVGVVIDSGSRYEGPYIKGISHFIEKLAFNSTSKFSSRDDIMQELEKHGGLCDCQGSRDTLIYAASCYSSSMEPVIEILSEAVLRPNLDEQEVEIAKQIIQFEIEDINMKPDQEPLIMELAHAVAYKDNTLGLPKICPSENVALIDRQHLFTYLKNHFTPERMVVAGVGVEHEELVESVQKHFVDHKPIWTQNPGLVLPQIVGTDNSKSVYTGGLITVEKDLSSVSLCPTPIPELAHLVIGFESSSHNDPDFIAFCTLNTMMGGGGSFSAGGPGKGMYTRLYTNVLNKHYWMHNATAYNHAYNDTGLFAIHASSHPRQLKQLVDVISKEFVNMSKDIDKVELDRAKAQLQSMLLMNLESRPIVFEDIGRQVLANGHRKDPSEFIEEINKITRDDIVRVATRLRNSKPSVSALGDIKNLPQFSDIDQSLSKVNLQQRFGLSR